eukprot:1646977-Alexandrium_andersonii.AAC.1
MPSSDGGAWSLGQAGGVRGQRLPQGNLEWTLVPDSETGTARSTLIDVTDSEAGTVQRKTRRMMMLDALHESQSIIVMSEVRASRVK